MFHRGARTADDSFGRLDDAPLRSAGGHRRYARYQLRIAARALVDQGTPVEAACQIIILEDPLEKAQHLNAAYRRTAEAANPAAAA
ncbi:hypothetical protein [Streptomyces sp. NPDC060031]|uniref:hypothetical protein n=1 Tax=Streptomyces sp. NPDC060031 TaxID=3347043 RepID=UPI00368C8899